MRKILLVTICVIAFAALPASAATATKVESVAVTTFSTYQSTYRGFTAKVVTPVVTGLINRSAQTKLNSELMAVSSNAISDYCKGVNDMLSDPASESGHLAVDSGYTVKVDNSAMLAFDVYVLNAVGSSSTTHKLYTIDKRKHALITLKGLFKSGADYVGVISNYITGEMKQRNAKSKGMYWVNDGDVSQFKTIKSDQNFYLNDRGNIVICFDKYEVAAGAQGSPEFEIPPSVIRHIRK